MIKTIKIPGRIESVATGKVVTGANAILDDTKGKKQNVINEETDAELLRLDQEKQGNLTFDQTPTEDSTNPVTSGGVYAAEQVLSQAIEAILLLIPSAASELNKLVDLATMNSSISTATASFKGTYNLVSDLHLTVSATHAQIAAALDALSLGADNNDYAFVQVPNTDTAPTDIAKTERYKFNGENWAYEYDLNNSGFTTAQWNAINSGITTLLVAKLSALPTNEALTLALAGKQDNLTFDNTPTAGSNNPVKSGGIYTRNNEIVALINALDAAKQNVLTFDTTPINGSTNPVTSNGVYLAIQLVQTAVVALDGRMGTAETKISTAEGNIVNLQAAYAALTQSDIVVVSGALPSSGQQQNIIYRQPDQDHTPPQFYSDYMWNGTAWVLMATYNNAIDDVPTAGSDNLVKSGGVKEALNEVNELINGVTVSYPSGSGGVSREASRQYFKLNSTNSYRVTCISVGGATSGKAQLYIMLNGVQQKVQTFDEGEALLIEDVQGDHVEFYTSTGVAGGSVKFLIENITGNVHTNKFVNVKELILDQGAVATDGSNLDSPYFVRSKMLSVTDDTTFYADNGYIIRGYAKYNRSTGVFIEFVQVNSRLCTVHDCVCRLSIRKVTDNTEITPKEVMLEPFLIDVKKDNVININRFGYSQGYINSVDGDEIDSSMLIRTTGYINVKDHTTFVCDEPFIIRAYAVYENGSFSNYVVVDDRICEIENCVCRFVVKNKIADTPIKPADFILDNEIMFNTNIDLHSLCFSQGHIYISDGDPDSVNPNYIKTDFLNIGRASNLYCDSNFLIRGYAIYDEYHHFVRYVYVNDTSTQVSKGIYRVVLRKYTDDTPITPSEFMKDSALDSVEDVAMLPIAHYNYDTTLLDVTSELNGIDMNAVDSLGCYTFQDQIYAKFDALVSAYPELVEKIDLGVYTGLSYPSYANLNGEALGDYLATPSYKTYMYKVAYPTSIANVGRTANKRKMLVVAGLHGWENASQLNTYIMASMLCKVANEDLYTLASAYDIYFIPCLNGYGAYHVTRVNANGVDINRNFPAYNWQISGEGTEHYSGPSSASEFETKMVIKAVELLKPDIFIDHHSYGAPVTYTFYVEPGSHIERDMCFTNLYAWNHRAYKDYGSYFGTSYSVHPAGFLSVSPQTSNMWAKNVGVVLSSTIEVCFGISYLNGQIASQSQAKSTYYQEPIVKLNELMLRLALLRYSEYELKNGIRTNKLNPALLV